MPLDMYVVKNPLLEHLFLSSPVEEYESRVLNTSSLDEVIALYPPVQTRELFVYLCALFFHGNQRHEVVINMLNLLGQVTYRTREKCDHMVLRLAVRHNMPQMINYLFTTRPQMQEHLVPIPQKKVYINILLIRQNFQVFREAALYGYIDIFNALTSNLSSKSMKHLKDNPAIVTTFFSNAAGNGHTRIVERIFELFPEHIDRLILECDVSSDNSVTPNASLADMTSSATILKALLSQSTEKTAPSVLPAPEPTPPSKRGRRAKISEDKKDLASSQITPKFF